VTYNKPRCQFVGWRRMGEGSYLWVLLVLHALHQHALDHLHVMLLLVAEDPGEVPGHVGESSQASRVTAYKIRPFPWRS